MMIFPPTRALTLTSHVSKEGTVPITENCTPTSQKIYAIYLLFHFEVMVYQYKRTIIMNIIVQKYMNLVVYNTTKRFD